MEDEIKFTFEPIDPNQKIEKYDQSDFDNEYESDDEDGGEGDTDSDDDGGDETSADGEERILKVRLDKWLWAARFFKTRALARAAVENGKVFYNNQRSKPSREIEIGAELQIRHGRFEKTVFVKGLSTRRRSTEEAFQLFEETENSRQNREKPTEFQQTIYTPYKPKQENSSNAYHADPQARDRRAVRFLRRSFNRNEAQPLTNEAPPRYLEQPARTREHHPRYNERPHNERQQKFTDKKPRYHEQMYPQSNQIDPNEKNRYDEEQPKYNHNQSPFAPYQGGQTKQQSPWEYET